MPRLVRTLQPVQDGSNIDLMHDGSLSLTILAVHVRRAEGARNSLHYKLAQTNLESTLRLDSVLKGNPDKPERPLIQH